MVGAIERFFPKSGVLEHDTIRPHDDYAHDTAESRKLRRVNTGVSDLVGEDNGSRPGGFVLVIDGAALLEVCVLPFAFLPTSVFRAGSLIRSSIPVGFRGRLQRRTPSTAVDALRGRHLLPCIAPPEGSRRQNGQERSQRHDACYRRRCQRRQHDPSTFFSTLPSLCERHLTNVSLCLGCRRRCRYFW